MPHPKKKKQRVTDADSTLGEDVATAGDLSTDVLANILGCLCVCDIMCSRGVNKKWKEAVKKTIVPIDTDFFVGGMESYNAMNVMTRAMPNLQQITIGDLGSGNKYSDGEDPYEEVAARTADRTPHDIGIISNFSKLRVLTLWNADLNGRYPFLFNFPLLQKFRIDSCRFLKWDLGLLNGFPLLKEFDCFDNRRMTGNISSLRVLKQTLETVEINNCHFIEGNLMDLADFPHLKKLDLDGTAVTGDIRDIGENDFSSLESLNLPMTVYGGSGSKLQHIADGPDVVTAVYLLNKHRPALKMGYWRASLWGNSPDWYQSMSSDHPPPFTIRLVKVGSRLGYQWESGYDPCEVNWLNPEPDRESSNYEEYIEKLQEINNEVQLYRGFHQPPTQEEYQRLIEALPEESDVHYWTLEFVDE